VLIASTRSSFLTVEYSYISDKPSEQDNLAKKQSPDSIKITPNFATLSISKIATEALNNGESIHG